MTPFWAREPQLRPCLRAIQPDNDHVHCKHPILMNLTTIERFGPDNPNLDPV
jgi:hypothetical protein